MLKNIGNVTLAGPFTVDDDKAAVTCPATASLAVGSSITCTATYHVTQADLDAGKVTNLATGHAQTLGGMPVNSNNASATVTAVQTRALTIDKVAEEKSYVKAGDLLHYSYLVTNAGNVTLHDAITVTDDKATVTLPGAAGRWPGAQGLDHLHGHLRRDAGGPGCGLGDEHRLGHGRHDHVADRHGHRPCHTVSGD